VLVLLDEDEPVPEPLALDVVAPEMAGLVDALPVPLAVDPDCDPELCAVPD
jgi:hypothetical protein